MLIIVQSVHFKCCAHWFKNKWSCKFWIDRKNYLI